MIKALLRTALILLILIIGFITFLLTPLGLKFTLNTVKPLIPGKLSYKSVSGVLIGPITFENLHYVDGKENIHIQKIRMNWQPWALIHNEFHISALDATNVHVVTKDSQLPNQLTIATATQLINDIIVSLKKKTIPFHVIINHANIHEFHFIDDKNNTHFEINQLSIEALLTKKQWKTTFLADIKKPQPYLFQLNIDGKPERYQVHASLSGHRIAWELNGTGNQNEISLKTPQTAFLNGSLTMQLQMQWHNTLTWQGKIEARHVNLSLLDNQWSNNASFRIDSKGDTNNGLTTDNIADVQTPLLQLHFVLGHQKTWQAQWNIKTQSLSNWIPNSTGNIASQGNLEGDLNNPQFQITVTGQLQNPKQTINHANIRLAGNFDKHTLMADIALPHQTLHLSLDGHYKDQQWSGLLQQLNVIADRTKPWHLKNPSAITASKNQIDVKSICMSSIDTGDVCVHGTVHNGNIDALAELSTSNLNWLNSWKNHVHFTQGKLNVNLHLQGTMQNPLLNGTLHLSQSNLIFPKLNTTIRNIAGTMTTQGYMLNVKATGYTDNHQPVTLEGSIDLAKSGFPIKAVISANNALIINTDEYQVYANTHITFDIADQKIVIKGDVTIPKATIKPNDTQATTTLPTDEIVYIGETHPPKSNWGIYTDIQVTFGNAVDINAAGVTAKLGGALHLQQQPGQDFFGTGEILIRNGHFSVYGQTLEIQSGSYLTFTHSLLSNPTLNLIASKTIASVTSMGIASFSEGNLIVGVDIRGPLKNYKIKFFSNRGNLSQADILSYILLGYGNTTDTPGNTDFLLRALSAVNITSQGLLGKQNIATQIQQGLGLSEMGVESETTVDALGNPLNHQSSFVVGKHLTRKLYARYSVGILDPVNVFQLRYLFNQHWLVQTDSSVLGNGMDVLYTFSRN